MHLRVIPINISSAVRGRCGVGDIVLRGKYAFASKGPFGLAGVVEARVPTVTRQICWEPVQCRRRSSHRLSRSRLALAPFECGYTFSSKGALPGTRLPDEVVATAGFDFAVNPRVTMSFDV